MISHTHSDILKQKNFTGSGFEGAPKQLKAFFTRLFLRQNYETLEVPNRAVFRPLIWNLAVLQLNNRSLKPYQSFFEILKVFQVIMIKLRRFRLRKCYFGVFAVNDKQSGLSKNADTVFDCKQCQIWKCNNWCHQTQQVWLGTPERENKGRKTRRSFSLFIWNYQIKIKQWFREFNKLFSDI